MNIEMQMSKGTPLLDLHEAKTKKRDERYKSNICYFYERSECANGDNCRFAHGKEELVTSINTGIPRSLTSNIKPQPVYTRINSNSVNKMTLNNSNYLMRTPIPPPPPPPPLPDHSEHVAGRTTSEVEAQALIDDHIRIGSYLASNPVYLSLLNRQLRELSMQSSISGENQVACDENQEKTGLSLPQFSHTKYTDLDGHSGGLKATLQLPLTPSTVLSRTQSFDPEPQVKSLVQKTVEDNDSSFWKKKWVDLTDAETDPDFRFLYGDEGEKGDLKSLTLKMRKKNELQVLPLQRTISTTINSQVVFDQSDCSPTFAAMMMEEKRREHEKDFNSSKYTETSTGKQKYHEGSLDHEEEEIDFRQDYAEFGSLYSIDYTEAETLDLGSIESDCNLEIERTEARTPVHAPYACTEESDLFSEVALSELEYLQKINEEQAQGLEKDKAEMQQPCCDYNTDDTEQHFVLRAVGTKNNAAPKKNAICSNAGFHEILKQIVYQVHFGANQTFSLDYLSAIRKLNDFPESHVLLQQHAAKSQSYCE